MSATQNTRAVSTKSTVSPDAAVDFHCQAIGVSVLIATRNRPELLLATIQSVLTGDDVPNEIVIVDQSDQPHMALENMKTQRQCHVRYEWSEIVGVARARNRAVALAQHDHLVIIDDDMLVTANWLHALVQALVTSGPTSVISGRVLPAPSPENSSLVPSTIVDEAPVRYQGRIGKDVLYSGNMAIMRQAMVAVGGFDERLGPGTGFPAAEDNDLGYRLLEAGYIILYAPDAALFHCVWRTEEQYLRLRWAYGVGRGAFYAKHSRWRDPYMLKRLTYDVASHLWRAGRHVPTNTYHARSDALLGLGLLNGAARWWLTQRQVAYTKANPAHRQA